MLPRWLTALPRFAATWRDELLVVALGFAYQAGVSGSLGAPRTHEHEQVVVRIATEQPRPKIASDLRVGVGMVAVPTVAVSAPMVHVAPMPRVHVTAPVRAVAPVKVRLHAPKAVTPDAGENVAADLMTGLDVTAVVVDTFTRPEVRESIARARAAMNEARVRAAIQKALAAERALQGPGA